MVFKVPTLCNGTDSDPVLVAQAAEMTSRSDREFGAMHKVVGRMTKEDDSAHSRLWKAMGAARRDHLSTLTSEPYELMQVRPCISTRNAAIGPGAI